MNQPQPGDDSSIFLFALGEPWFPQGYWRIGYWQVSRFGGGDNHLAPAPEAVEKIRALIHKRQRLVNAKKSVETVVVGTADFQFVSFMKEGADRSRAVCRIAKEFSLSEFRDFIEKIKQGNTRSFNSISKLIDIFSIPDQVFPQIFTSDQISGKSDRTDVAGLLDSLKNIDASILAKLNPLPVGTGFLVGGNHILTNHHVVPDAAVAEQCIAQFSYVQDARGNTQESIDYALNPRELFITNPDLDYTLVQLNTGVFTKQAGYNFGWITIAEDEETITPGWLEIPNDSIPIEEFKKNLEQYIKDSDLLKDKIKKALNADDLQVRKMLETLNQDAQISVESADGKLLILVNHPFLTQDEIEKLLLGDANATAITALLSSKQVASDNSIQASNTTPTNPVYRVMGDKVFIIQHPRGQEQQIVLSDNNILPNGLYQNFLRYRADSDYGSSGSPVFNEKWQLVALHHAAIGDLSLAEVIAVSTPAQKLELAGETPETPPTQQGQLVEAIAASATPHIYAQQGVRICRIVEDLKQKSLSLPKLRNFMDDFVVTKEQFNYPPLPIALEFDGVRSCVSVDGEVALTFAGTKSDGSVVLVEWSKGGVQLSQFSITTGEIAPGQTPGNRIWLSQDGQLIAVVGQRIATKDGDRYPVELRERTGTLLYTLTDYSGVITCASFSPDGHLLATGSVDRQVKLWDVRSGQRQATLDCSGAVVDVTFKPDSQEIVTSSSVASIEDKQLQWWDRSGNELRTYALDSLFAIAHRLTFSPNGQTLAFVNSNNLLELLNVEPQTPANTPLSKDNFSQVLEVEISSAEAGEEILAVYHSSRISLWTKQGNLLNRNNPFEDVSYFIKPKLSPDGKLLATGSGNQVNLWNTQGELLGSATVGEESYLVREIQFSLQRQPDRDQQLLMAVAAYGQQFGRFQFHLYQLSWQGQELQLTRLQEINHNEGSGTEYGMDFSSDGNLLVTNDGRTITVLNLGETNQPVVARLTLPDGYFEIVHLSLSHDGQVIAFTISNSPSPQRGRQEPAAVFFWNWKTTRSTASLDVKELPQLDYGGAINSIQFFHTRFLFLITGGNGIHVYSFGENQQPETLSSRPERSGNVQISPDERTIAFTDQGKVKLWDFVNNAIALLADGKIRQISAMALSQDALVTSHLDVVQLWNLDGTLFKTLGSSSLVNDCSFSLHPSGRYLFTTGKDGTLKGWDLQNPNQPRLVTENSTRNAEALGVATGSYRDDSAMAGGLIASANQDGRVDLWRMPSQPQSDIELERLNLLPILLSSSQDGYVGGSLRFNHRHQEVVQNQGLNYSADRYSFGGTEADDTRPFSIEAWINPYPDGFGGTVISKWREDNQGEYLLAITPQGTVRFSLRSLQPYRDISTLESSRRLPFGQFHHLVARYEKWSMQIFIDGELDQHAITVFDNATLEKEDAGQKLFVTNSNQAFRLQEPNATNNFVLLLERGILSLNASWGDPDTFTRIGKVFSFSVKSQEPGLSPTGTKNVTYQLQNLQLFETDDGLLFRIARVTQENDRLILWTNEWIGAPGVDPLTPLLIGAHFSDPANVKSPEQITTGFFKGIIAEVRIWNKAISVEQIQKNMHSRLNPAEHPSLIGYWRFDEGTGDRVINLAAPASSATNSPPIPSYGKALHPKWLNAARFPALPLPFSLRFNGEDAYIDCGHVPQIINAITVEAWVKHCSGDGLIVCRGGGWQDSGYSLFWCRGKIRVELQNTSRNMKLTIDTQENAPSDNAWHHIAFTWTQQLANREVEEVEVYVDGRRQNVIAVTGESKSVLSGGLYKSVGIFRGPIGEQEVSLTIGGMAPGDLDNKQQSVIYFDGAIAEVRLWKVARTQNEIKANLYRRLNVQEENKQETKLVGYWRLDEAVTVTPSASLEPTQPTSTKLGTSPRTYSPLTRVRDLSSNNLHGAIYGAEWFPLTNTVSGNTSESAVSLTLPSPPEAISTPETPSEPTPEQSEPRVLVAEVIVEGPRDLQNDVYSVIRTQPGRITTRSQLQEDMNAILATGYFSNVQVVPEDTPLGVRVTFVVDAKPVLRFVRIEGAEVLAASSPSSQFDDLENHWAKDKILALASRGIVKGYPDRTFKPNTPMNRAEFAAILAQAFKPAASNSSRINFSDISADFWARQAIEQVWGSGLMTGISGNQFSPHANMTRLQTAVILVNCLLKQQKPLPTPDRDQLRLFTDLKRTDGKPLGDGVLDGLAIAVQLGIVAKAASFRPNDAATRAEVAVMVSKALCLQFRLH